VSLSQGPYEAARAAFSAYAAMDGPRLPESPWSALQVRLARWQAANFGAVPASQNALGVAEELGELAEELTDDLVEWLHPLVIMGRLAGAAGRVAHAVLKGEQRIRGMADPEARRRRIADGVADMLIYATQLCTSFRLDFGTLYRETAEEVMARDWLKNPGGPPG